MVSPLIACSSERNKEVIGTVAERLARTPQHPGAVTYGRYVVHVRKQKVWVYERGVAGAKWAIKSFLCFSLVCHQITLRLAPRVTAVFIHFVCSGLVVIQLKERLRRAKRTPKEILGGGCRAKLPEAAHLYLS
jgi:hypothetical protein